MDTLKEKYPRAGFEGLLFFEICADVCISMKEEREELAKLERLRSKGRSLRRRSVEELGLLDEINKHECVAITFAAMCLESCIWDYAASSTSQSYTEDYLEKLDFVARWVLIPKLTCGADITQARIGDTCLLDKLRKLRKARNALVHAKSHSQPNTLTGIVKAMNRKRDITGVDAFGLIGLLLRELENVDKTKWWLFRTPAYRHSMGRIRAT